MLGRGGPLALALFAALAGCTDPIERARAFEIHIDADSVVRANTVSVEITLGAQNDVSHGGSNKTWDSVVMKTFEPDPANDADWPWQHTVPSEESSFDRYNLIAIARDSQDGVVGRVQALRTLEDVREHGLRLRFDSACFRRTKLCDNGFTCAAGSCIDANLVSRDGRDPLDVAGRVDDPQQPVMDDSPGVAETGTACKDGARACVEHGSRAPLLCESGNWRAQPECPEDQRCSTADGANRGTCQPVADECLNRQPTVPYCDGDVMRVCTDLIESEVRTCGDNERCMTTGTGARCVCGRGFSGDPGRCVRANECGSTTSVCDPLTRCSMQSGSPVCGACPSGYTGTGDRGCVPQLQGLQLSAGKLEPALAADLRAYRVRLPLVAPQIVLTPSLPVGSSATLNGVALGDDGKWSSPVLPLGETDLMLELTTEFGTTTKYTITCERAGEQQAYVKAEHPGSYNQFGTALAMSGETLVVTAWFDDSNAIGINGDPTNTSATDSGAAFVYVRDAAGWKQQAYIKPSDTMSFDYFGASAAIEGDTLVIGAIHEGVFQGTSGPSRPGVAYVFTRKAGEWSQTQILAGKSERADLYGTSVDLDGDTLVVSAPWDATGGERAGAVYVYERDGGSFREVQKLVSSKPAAQAALGTSLSLQGDRLAVGAPDEPPPHMRPGSAEVFARSGGKWSSTQLLSPTTLGGASNFGFSVSLDGDRLAIGAPYTAAYPGSPTPTKPGEVYVFQAGVDGFQQTARIKAPNPRDTDWFGMSVQVTDSALIIGAPGDVSGGRGIASDAKRTDAPFSGAVYVYAHAQPDAWVPAAFIKGDNTGENDWFGAVVLADGPSLVVAAPFENGGGSGVTSGAAYVFR